MVLVALLRVLSAVVQQAYFEIVEIMKKPEGAVFSKEALRAH
jgi:hypothetical protein